MAESRAMRTRRQEENLANERGRKRKETGAEGEFKKNKEGNTNHCWPLASSSGAAPGNAIGQWQIGGNLEGRFAVAGCGFLCVGVANKDGWRESPFVGSFLVHSFSSCWDRRDPVGANRRGLAPAFSPCN
ncbi:uncharacterized protein SPSK_10328 [Sporothrix schenckii 1099-18]|uniref:Uncharacterized protein n=1 Tax=Sporothrix schenckii 1099-18 TaxID=1397361 RepID=A0A0F2LT78_SPOSC|nr:uncharacterized protein SPSK_10328 [Sporothrix schenckii 1099-18]KJR80059.1 hypothetical protein SPSK_10328 [Sporothrix schenckii 1099-18]